MDIIIGVAIGALLGWRLMTMSVRIWRAWRQAKSLAQAEAEAKRLRKRRRELERVRQGNIARAALEDK